MSTPAEKTKAANEDALRHMHRVRRCRVLSARARLGRSRLLTRRRAAGAQTKESDDTRFSNPAGHVAEPPGAPHQVGLSVSREAHDEPPGTRTEPPQQR